MLERGVIGWMPAVTVRGGGYLAASDFAGVLDNVASALFLDAYGDTVKTFEPWTTAATVADFRSPSPPWSTSPSSARSRNTPSTKAARRSDLPSRYASRPSGASSTFSRAAALRDDVPEFAATPSRARRRRRQRRE